jgi:hypothetical protein
MSNHLETTCPGCGSPVGEAAQCAWCGLHLRGPEATEVRRARARTQRPYDASRLVKFLGGVALVGAAAATIAVAGSVRTDRGVLVGVPFAATVTILVVSVALGPVLCFVLAAGRRISGLRPVVVGAARCPAVVRVLLAAAMVVALTAVVLGASVGGREARLETAVAGLQQVPVLPPGVMAVTTGHTRDGQAGVLAGTPGLDQAPLGSPGEAISDESVAAIRRRYPDAEVIPVTSIPSFLFPPPSSWLFCLFDSRCATPVIVADPRLADVYGQTAQPSNLHLALLPPDNRGTASPSIRSTLTVQPLLSAPRAEDLIGRGAEGGRAPAATFQGLVALEINPDLVTKFALPTQRTTVFITRRTPFTAEERSALHTLVPTATAITADDHSENLRPPHVGTVPWAPTETATQWWITIIAAVIALLAVSATAVVNTRDRRRDNARLPLPREAPRHTRQASALHTGLVLAVGAILAAAAVTALVAFGVHRFSAHQPAIAVPFVFPFLQIAFLVVGVPLLGALIAATRPPAPGHSERPGPDTRRPLGDAS